MKFLVDESAPARIAEFLRSQGHDVTRVGTDYAQGLPDEDVLALSHSEQRVLVTNDSDFGELIFKQGLPHSGVIFFRLGYAPMETRIALLERVLRDHAGELGRFIVVTRTQIRVRLADVGRLQ
jgi:predicted nuclease of predicted toxin-antitoxin system